MTGVSSTCSGPREPTGVQSLNLHPSGTPGCAGPEPKASPTGATVILFSFVVVALLFFLIYFLVLFFIPFHSLLLLCCFSWGAAGEGSTL